MDFGIIKEGTLIFKDGKIELKDWVLEDEDAVTENVKSSKHSSFFWSFLCGKKRRKNGKKTKINVLCHRNSHPFFCLLLGS